MLPFFAHSSHSSDERYWQLLKDHLKQVAQLAVALAEGACPGDRLFHQTARAAGLLHDLGKYQAEWQSYLKAAAAGAASAMVPHAIYGAASAYFRLDNPALAWVIAGHHAGLPDSYRLFNDTFDPQAEALQTTLNVLEPLARAELGEWPSKLPCSLTADDRRTRHRYELWSRFLFSVLIDADRLNTAEASTGWVRSRDGLSLQRCETLLAALALERQKRSQGRSDLLTNLRNRVFEACRTAGEEKQGFFDLTVPTGGGKTISGMAFALAHARRHHLRRVIVVIPFLSIIEQNAREYREIFGPSLVVEHHSAVEEDRPSKEAARRTWAELATENWDVPIIVTTSVQFLETLLAASPRSCRKLHNIARSVVLFDEAQALPVHLLNPLMNVFRELVRGYGVSIVLSTATQPAFRQSPGLKEGLRPEELQPILPEGLQKELFDGLRRVSYRVETRQFWSWDTLVNRLAEHPRALCVLNTRRHARQVWELLRARVRDEQGKGAATGVIHLSSGMCAQHRLDVFGDRKKPAPGTVHFRLRRREPCWLVSTQVIEAGVDVDFPAVFRALGPLDSIVQAAGRCNREGRLTDEKTGQPRRGEVTVFQPEDAAIPTGFYQLATGLAQTLLTGEVTEEQLATDFRVFARYFDLLFQRSSTDVARRGERPLQAERADFNFRTVAERARVIEDGGIPVIVPYGIAPKLVAAIRKAGFFTRRTLRKLQRYLVNLRARDVAILEKCGQLVMLLNGDADGPMVLSDGSYHDQLGVLINQASPDEWIV